MTELNISWCDSVTENGIEVLARGCPKLKKVSAKGCRKINDRAIIFLALYCPNIEYLNLHSCDVSSICKAVVVVLW